MKVSSSRGNSLSTLKLHLSLGPYGPWNTRLSMDAPSVCSISSGTPSTDHNVKGFGQPSASDSTRVEHTLRPSASSFRPPPFDSVASASAACSNFENASSPFPTRSAPGTDPSVWSNIEVISVVRFSGGLLWLRPDGFNALFLSCPCLHGAPPTALLAHHPLV